MRHDGNVKSIISRCFFHSTGHFVNGDSPASHFEWLLVSIFLTLTVFLPSIAASTQVLSFWSYHTEDPSFCGEF